MNNNMLVKLEAYSLDYLRLTVYDRNHWKSDWGFLISRDRLGKAINEHEDRLMDYDGYDFLILQRGHDLKWEGVWTILDGDCDNLYGRRVHIKFNEADFKVLLLGYETCIKWIQHDRLHNSKIKLSARAMHHIPSDPLKKRAFIKAMRDSFKWGPESTIILHPDGDLGFYFEEIKSGKHGICGGLVEHSREIRGKDGRRHLKYYYSIHT